MKRRERKECRRVKEKREEREVEGEEEKEQLAYQIMQLSAYECTGCKALSFFLFIRFYSKFYSVLLLNFISSEALLLIF